MNDKNQERIWIVNFADQTQGSCFGTYQQAMEKS